MTHFRSIILAAVTLSLGLTGCSPDVSALVNKVERAEADKVSAMQEATKAKDEAAALRGELKAANQRVAELTKTNDGLNARVGRLEKSLSVANANTAAARGRVDFLVGELKQSSNASPKPKQTKPATASAKKS
jgi:septal ring factor EnvC (AmiA/AmiB activator)